MLKFYKKQKKYNEIQLTKNKIDLRGSYGGNQPILVISIVIDSDRGHCYEPFKKYIYIYDEN